MAAKSLTGGELYFVGEKDPMTNEDTQFVKIGIVRDNDARTTDYRVKEHQTGNPRLLHAVSIIRTPIVERVETTMHGKFAPMRLSGEWFVFTLVQRASAIAAAEELANSARAHEQDMVTAAEVKNLQSVGEVATPSDELLSLHLQLVGLRAQVKECKQLADSVVKALEDASKRGVDVGRLLSIQDKKGAERFNEESFKASHPDLWSQYVKNETKISGSFRLTDSVKNRPDPYSLYPELTDLKARIESSFSISDSDISQLHAMYLQVLTVQSPAEWKVMLLEDQIKSECGTAPGIVGVCDWTREETTKESFDKAAMKAAHPDLYAEFITVAASTTAVVPARDRGFQI